MSLVEALAVRCARNHPDLAAHTLEAYSPEEAARLLQELDPDDAAGVLSRMDGWFAARCVTAMEDHGAAAIMSRLDADMATPLLRRLSGEVKDRILDGVPERQAATWIVTLRYPENTAGALMDPLVVSCSEDETADRGLESIRREPDHTVAYLYVTTRDQRLVGVVGIPELVASPPDRAIRELITRSVSRLHVDDERAIVLAHPGWQRFSSLPVVDEQGKLVGVLRYEAWRALHQNEDLLQPSAGVGLAASMSELLWLGMAGVAQGIGTVATRGLGDEEES